MSPTSADHATAHKVGGGKGGFMIFLFPSSLQTNGHIVCFTGPEILRCDVVACRGFNALYQSGFCVRRHDREIMDTCAGRYTSSPAAEVSCPILNIFQDIKDRRDTV